MKISVLTLFPQMFEGPFKHSIIDRAIKDNKLEINFIDIRDFGIGKHKIVDDKPYGGGKGMVLRVDVIKNALDHALKTNIKNQKAYLLSARGNIFNQEKARQLSKLDHMVLICGHYEAVDERIEQYIDGYISVGDFITTGGEIPAMLIIDSVARLTRGVLSEEATENESFSLEYNNRKLLEHPHYTTPHEYNGSNVPDILTSGNHKKINEYRLNEAIRITKKFRSDLLTKEVED